MNGFFKNNFLFSDGVPMASMFLRGFVERDNGTFIPTAPPVVNGNRFYVLTQFVPNMDDYSVGINILLTFSNFTQIYIF